MMKITTTTLAIAGAVALTAFAAGGSQAATGNLAPGGAVSPVSTTSVVFTNTLASETVSFTSPGSTYSGSLLSKVVNEGAANSLGGLTFVFQLTNNSSTPNNPNGSEDLLSRFSDQVFSGYQTSVFYDTSSGTFAPSSATRSAGLGASVFFNFLNGNGQASLPAGTTSDYLVIRTDATTFTNALAGVSDGTTVNVASYMPGTPEPTSVASFGLGGLGLLGLMVRARKARKTVA
jgi:hypothetical protein